MQKRAENKVELIGTLLLYGLMELYDYHLEKQKASKVKKDTGMTGAKLKVADNTNIARASFGSFATTEKRKCRSGLELTYDNADYAISLKYSKGPIKSCIEDMCKSVMENIGYDAKQVEKKCIFKGTHMNVPLMLTPEEMDKWEQKKKWDQMIQLILIS